MQSCFTRYSRCGASEVGGPSSNKTLPFREALYCCYAPTRGTVFVSGCLCFTPTVTPFAYQHIRIVVCFRHKHKRDIVAI